MSEDWSDSLERDIEVAEGQIALALVLPEPTKAFIQIEAERLKRLVVAAKLTLTNRNEPCPKGDGKHSWIGDAGDSWCQKCGEALLE